MAYPPPARPLCKVQTINECPPYETKKSNNRNCIISFADKLIFNFIYFKYMNFKLFPLNPLQFQYLLVYRMGCRKHHLCF